VVYAPLDVLRERVIATEQSMVKVSTITTQEFAFANPAVGARSFVDGVYRSLFFWL